MYQVPVGSFEVDSPNWVGVRVFLLLRIFSIHEHQLCIRTRRDLIRENHSRGTTWMLLRDVAPVGTEPRLRIARRRLRGNAVPPGAVGTGIGGILESLLPVPGPGISSARSPGCARHRLLASHRPRLRRQSVVEGCKAPECSALAER